MKYRTTYFLREPNADRETAIVAHYYFAGQRVKFATGMTIHPKKWNPSTMRAKRGVKYEALINARLEAIDLRLATIYTELRARGSEPSASEIAERFRAIDSRPNAVDLVAAYDRFLEAAAHRLQPGTIKLHRTARNHLEAFGQANDIALRFERVDVILLEKFTHYLLTVIGLTNTSAWSVIKLVRAFLRWSEEQGLTDNNEYRKFTQRRLPKGEKSDAVYLSTDELEAIVKLDLREDERLSRVRDLFLFQAHTGLRFGDVQRLRSEHVDGDSIRLVLGKNRKPVTIPLLPLAAKIWKRYKGRLPKISNQKANVYLKEIAKLAGIDAPTATVDYRGAKRIEATLPKYELIGSHSAKRTFVTLMRRRGVSIETLMAITGNTRKTLERYILTTESDVAREVRAAWKDHS